MNLNELRERRPPRREVVDAHKQRRLAETRVWRLRELREQAGLTQAQLAEELHVAPAQVSKIERGDVDKTRVETLRRYAKALGGDLRVTVEIGDISYQVA